MSKPKLVGEATKEQIEAWKKKYKEVKGVICEGHIAYFRKPDRAIMSCSSAALENGAWQYGEELYRNCKLGGSPLFDTDDDFYLAGMQVVKELAETKQIEIVKL